MASKIIRFMETDIDSSLRIDRALMKIKGISFSFAHAVVGALQLHGKRMEELTDEEMKRLEDCIMNPKKYGIPAFMLNHQKEFHTGEDMHLTVSKLAIKLREDTMRLKRIRSYRGIRHELGLPVRGQRTKSTFRKNKKVKIKKKK